MTQHPESTEPQASRKKIALGPRVKKFATATGLGIVSAAAYDAQQKGLTVGIEDDFLRGAAESLSHPVLGYVGAWIGTAGLKRVLPDREKLTFPVAAAVATAANFATEFAQDIVVRTSEFQFLTEQQTGETIKDYVFALGGAGLYLWQNRRAKQLS